uniref:Arginine vasopressin-induced protein 1 n=1 Tax=Malurus cyaneus samueli TaxID=2593467 RepID=A0A8C5TI19_9PASS
MGTPASVVNDSPGRAAPAARGRKRASANIFQGVGLLELRSLFRSGGRAARGARPPRLAVRRPVRPGAAGQPGQARPGHLLNIHFFPVGSWRRSWRVTEGPRRSRGPCSCAERLEHGEQLSKDTKCTGQSAMNG